MVYNVFIGIALGIIASIVIVGLLCIMLIAGENDRKVYNPKKNKKKSSKK